MLEKLFKVGKILKQFEYTFGSLSFLINVIFIKLTNVVIKVLEFHSHEEFKLIFKCMLYIKKLIGSGRYDKKIMKKGQVQIKRLGSQL